MSVDTISLDVPLLIRLLEYAREDSQNDMQLHVIAENLVALGRVATMKDYASVIPSKKKRGAGTYALFVKEHMKHRPAGTTAAEYMKVIAKKWHQN